MIDKDIEPDVSEERQQQIRALYKQYGETTKILLALQRITGQPLAQIVFAWKETRRELEQSLKATGRSYGP